MSGALTCNSGHPYDYYSSRAQPPSHWKGSLCSRPAWNLKIILQFLHWPSRESESSSSSPNLWHSNSTHLGHQTSWSEGSPPKNLKPHCDFATGIGRLAHQFSPPVLRRPFHLAASSWLLASLLSSLALTSMSVSSRALFVSATLEDSSFLSSNQKRSPASPSEPYSTTPLRSTVAVSLSKAHNLCDLLMRYRMSSGQYQAWSSSLNRKIVLKILNHGVLLLRLFSCDVRLYTTVASLCHFSRHSTTRFSSIRFPPTTPWSVFTHRHANWFMTWFTRALRSSFLPQGLLSLPNGALPRFKICASTHM